MITDGLSLDQLRIFQTVVEEGSFSAAARKYGRAQSAITYAIQTLESQLGITLFDRSPYRPNLTEAGRAILPRIDRLLQQADILKGEANSLASGLEAGVSIVVDSMFPMSALVHSLTSFQAHFPTVTTHLSVEIMGAARAQITGGHVDLGLVVESGAFEDSLTRYPLRDIELVVVAAPHHPLARVHRALYRDDVADHVQLVLTDKMSQTGGRDYGVLSLRTWRLTDLGAKHAMLLAGLGWGSMPLENVAADIQERRLVRLEMGEWDGGRAVPHLPTALVHRRDQPLGPATRWLIEKLTHDVA